MSKRKLIFRAVGLLFTFQVKKLRCSLPLLPSHRSASLWTLVLSSQRHCHWSLKGHRWTPICQVIFLPQTFTDHPLPTKWRPGFWTRCPSCSPACPAPVGSALSHSSCFHFCTHYLLSPPMSVLMLFLHPGIPLCLFCLLTFMHPLKSGPLVTIVPQCSSQNDVFFLCAPQHLTVKTGSHFFTLPWSVCIQLHLCVFSYELFDVTALSWVSFKPKSTKHSTSLALTSLGPTFWSQILHFIRTSTRHSGKEVELCSLAFDLSWFVLEWDRRAEIVLCFTAITHMQLTNHLHMHWLSQSS